MYGMKEEDCFQSLNNIQDYQDHQFLIQHQQILPWFDPTNLPSNPTSFPDPPHFSTYFNRRSSSPPFFDGFGASTGLSMDHHHPQNHLRILTEALGPIIRPGSGLAAGGFGFEGEMGKMTAQEIMDAKALAASKSHSEAERRRRERINNHLAKLRSMLPNTTKTDKASLLAEVIQHMKELKRQTSLIAETCPVPTEADELTVDLSYDGNDGNFVIKASFCCQDRSDLIHDVIKALKSLSLRTLKAEIATVGGRVKNVLFITGEENSHQNDNNDINGGSDEEQKGYCVRSLQETLKAVIEKCVSGDNNIQQSPSGSVKRQRTNNIITRCY